MHGVKRSNEENGSVVDVAERTMLRNYRQAPIAIERGEGCEVFDRDGNGYLDMSAGIATSSLGHGHPALVQAIAAQASKVIHTSNYFLGDTNVKLAKALCAKMQMPRVFFCNSGSEANEALLKLARRYFYSKGERTRTKIVAFENGFHGRTLGALSITGKAAYREGFGALGDIVHLPFGDVEALERTLDKDVAAVIIEPIQGEGGVLPAPEGFLKHLRAQCTSVGALLFLDEVQTGVGRVGRWLASHGQEADPDAVALAKGLAGGVPIGAMLTKEYLVDALPPGTHGATFGGNALASAAALAVLETIESEGLLENAAKCGALLARGLNELVQTFPSVCESSRGEGLLQGLVLHKGMMARDWLPRFYANGLLVTAAGDRVIRLTPPLIVREEQIGAALSLIRETLHEGARS